MEYSSDDVKVSDPVYVVRKRLAQELEGSDTREEDIERTGEMDAKFDNTIISEIRNDYQSEMSDAISGMEGGMGGMMGGPMQMQQPGEGEEDDLSDEEAQERMQQFMRLSSLQLAYQGYPVFKSIVMN